MSSHGPISLVDHIRVAISFIIFAINVVVVGFVVYYEFVMKKRRPNLFNSLYLICHTFLTLVFVIYPSTFWFDGQSIGNSWLNFFVDFSFKVFMGTYVAIMYIKTKGLLTLKRTLHYVAKGLSITCFLLIFFAELSYFVSSMLVTFNNGLNTPLSLLLINVIDLYLNYGSGSILAALDIFYLMLFRQFLRSNSILKNSSNGGTREKKGTATRSDDNLNLRIISWFGGLSSSFSILSLLLYVLSPFTGVVGYFPVFVSANFSIMSILGMKLSLDRYWAFAVNLARGEGGEKKTRTNGSSEKENSANVISSIKFPVTNQEEK